MTTTIQPCETQTACERCAAGAHDECTDAVRGWYGWQSYASRPAVVGRCRCTHTEGTR